MTIFPATLAALAFALAGFCGEAHAMTPGPDATDEATMASAQAQGSAALPHVTTSPAVAGVVLGQPRVVRHGDHLAVVAMVRQDLQTAKILPGQLVARYRQPGATSDTIRTARCDAHRWQESCAVALDLQGAASQPAIAVTFRRL